jgi:hypothetical protein
MVKEQLFPSLFRAAIKGEGRRRLPRLQRGAKVGERNVQV